MSAFSANFSSGVMQTLVGMVAPSLRFPLTIRVDLGRAFLAGFLLKMASPTSYPVLHLKLLMQP